MGNGLTIYAHVNDPTTNGDSMEAPQVNDSQVLLVREADTTWSSDLITGLGGQMQVRRLLTKEQGGTDRFAVVLAKTEPGGEHGWHCRPEDEAIVLLEGQCTLSYKDADDEAHDLEMGAGDAALIPAGITHKNNNNGDSQNLILGIHSPAHR